LRKKRIFDDLPEIKGKNDWYINLTTILVKYSIGHHLQHPVRTAHSRLGCLKDFRKEEDMEGIIFLVIWLGCASLHTLFDLKIKPFLKDYSNQS
jgi:hypothetical protein